MKPAVLVAVLVLAGCAGKKTPPAIVPLPPNSADYFDLAAGWRLRIVAAITKSGRSDVVSSAVKQEGNVITLQTSADMIGYETAYWSVTQRAGGGVELRLASATLTVDGNPSAIEKPTRALLHLPRSARYIRAFYLTRQSVADHNMAIAGMSRREDLEDFTRAFRESPEQACAGAAERCEWIPSGVAVRPQVPKRIDGVTVWPAQ